MREARETVRLGAASCPTLVLRKEFAGKLQM